MKRLKIMLAIIALAAPALAFTAAASASTHGVSKPHVTRIHRDTFSNEGLCDDESTELCFSDVGTGAGNTIYGKTYSSDKEETMTATAAWVCGTNNDSDQVTSTCPFAVGSGWNSDLIGDDIVYVGRSDSPDCIRGTGDGNDLESASCSDSGVLWVQDGKTPDSGYYYVNVADSNGAAYTYGATAGNQNGPITDQAVGCMLVCGDSLTESWHRATS